MTKRVTKAELREATTRMREGCLVLNEWCDNADIPKALAHDLRAAIYDLTRGFQMLEACAEGRVEEPKDRCLCSWTRTAGGGPVIVGPENPECPFHGCVEQERRAPPSAPSEPLRCGTCGRRIEIRGEWWAHLDDCGRPMLSSIADPPGPVIGEPRCKRGKAGGSVSLDADGANTEGDATAPASASPAPCPGCGRVLDWPHGNGRWRLRYAATRGYQHERQQGYWVDCPGKPSPAVPDAERIAEIRAALEKRRGIKGTVMSSQDGLDLLAAYDAQAAEVLRRDLLLTVERYKGSKQAAEIERLRGLIKEVAYSAGPAHHAGNHKIHTPQLDFGLIEQMQAALKEPTP